MDFKKEATMLFNTLHYCSVADSIKDIEKSLRDVQRETAEECCHILYFTDMPEVPSTWQEAVSYIRDAIRERFGLKEKP